MELVQRAHRTRRIETELLERTRPEVCAGDGIERDFSALGADAARAQT